MKYFFIILIFTFKLFAQDTNMLDANGKRHGLWRGIYETSKRPRYEGTFNHGRETGIFKFFDDTKAGSIIATRDFTAVDGSAYTIFFDQNGNKVSEGKEVNKLANGLWKYYHFKSPEIMTLEYYVEGKLNGERKVFYKNGILAEQANFVNDVKDGTYKKFNEKGTLLEESFYKNGVLDGPAMFDDGFGKVTKGQYKDGKKFGIWSYFENGKLMKKQNPNKIKQDKFKIDSKNKDARKRPENRQ
ncbi:hypothetical protein GV828_04005 [Flavobacterium sp. NST-5]|uniref:Preprotein translocase YidC n=1 Tax=Flavobacterium ichthyis TaxID=2698827 RepID=A0ABW9ZB97_9FLAO|nr:hypothetical protein [Flavobacterium ichthyis]NBL64365.1 hypothetical protein [Flavobacterium ichthyis]